MSELALPEGWLQIKLGSVIEYGKTDKVQPHEVADDTWVLELEDIEKNSSKLLKKISFRERQSKSTKNRFEKGDVLYGKLRPYLNKVLIANEDGISSTEILPLKTNEYLNNMYLFFWLKSPVFLQYVTQVGYGVNMPRLGTKDGKNAPFVLAPLSEQKVIAQLLDTSFQGLSQIQARLDAIPKLIEKFRQSVLKSYLLEGDVAYKSYILGDIVDIISGVAFKKAQYTESGSKLLQISNVGHGHIRWKSKLFIPDELAEEFSEYKLQKKDIILALNRPITHNKLKVATIHEKDIPSVLYQRVARLRVSDSSKVIDSSYLFILMQSGFFRKLVTEKLKGSDQPYLNFSDLKQFSLDLPSLDYQREVVDRIDNFILYADQIEKSVAIAKARVDNLTQSILHQAFTGQLTKEWREQNPELISGDNSAEALLAKIEAEKKASGKKGKAKK